MGARLGHRSSTSRGEDRARTRSTAGATLLRLGVGRRLDVPAIARDAGRMSAGPALPFDRAAVDAVSLDVGGVLLVPDHGLLGHALTGRRRRPRPRPASATGTTWRWPRSTGPGREPEVITDYVGRLPAGGRRGRGADLGAGAPRPRAGARGARVEPAAARRARGRGRAWPPPACAWR